MERSPEQIILQVDTGQKTREYNDRVYTRDYKSEVRILRTKTVIRLKILYSDNLDPASIFK